MTQTVFEKFVRVLWLFSLVHVSSTNMEEEGFIAFMTSCRPSQYIVSDPICATVVTLNFFVVAHMFVVLWLLIPVDPNCLKFTDSYFELASSVCIFVYCFRNWKLWLLANVADSTMCVYLGLYHLVAGCSVAKKKILHFLHVSEWDIGQTENDSPLVKHVYWQDLALLAHYWADSCLNAQDGSVCIRDILASFLDSGREVLYIYSVKCAHFKCIRYYFNS